MGSWLDRIVPISIRPDREAKKHIPDGLWSKCEACEAILYRPELIRNFFVCPKCGFHIRISARTRLSEFLDEGSGQELFHDLSPTDYLKFRDVKKYKDRLNQAQKETGENDALISIQGRLKGRPVIALAFEFRFMGGSMGRVVGEKFLRSTEAASSGNQPLICFSGSGGARMQEALFSLMQMARTVASVEKMKNVGIPFISVLTDPVFGGVTASFAMRGDINIAEPGALIGFAGPRVIEQTVGEVLPEGFQRSEFLLEHGTVDMIIPRPQQRDRIFRLLSLLKP